MKPIRIAYFSRGSSIHDERFLRAMLAHQLEPILIAETGPPLVPVANEIPCYLIPRGPFFRQVSKLKQILQTIHPDILHAGELHHFSFLAALTGFKPFFAMSWGFDIFVKRKNPLNHFKIKVALKQAQRALTDCQAIQKIMIEQFHVAPQKTLVFPWGIDLSRFKKNEAKRLLLRTTLGWQDNIIFIMTRNFTPLYGVLEFVQSIPQWIKLSPNVRFILVGDGPLKTTITKIIQQKNLSSYIHLTGNLSEEALAHHLQAADVYISNAKCDGTSISMLEAMAAGLPIVLSHLPSSREWVHSGKNGFIVNHKMPLQQREAMLSLIQNQPMREQMGEYNQQLVKEKGDWGKNFQILLKAYQDAMN